MKKVTLSILGFCCLLLGFTPKPKPVIGIVVDQMRQDYLLRFKNKFLEGATKATDEQWLFLNMHITTTSLPTQASGHASIYSGTTPSNSEHGKAGTTHGSEYTYDTYVPVLFSGSNTRKGSSVREGSITDIAPTLFIAIGNFTSKLLHRIAVRRIVHK
ncbi:MAG: hypothetical protein AAGI25_15890 [Bacteroidota bacterium]